MRRLWLAGGDETVPDDSWEVAETLQRAMGSMAGHVPHVLSAAPDTHGCAALLGWCHRERCWPLQEIGLRVGETPASPSAFVSADSARASGFSSHGEWRWTRPAPVPARQAYERTSVEVDGLPALIPGEPVPAEALERGTFHVITAHNPAGLRYSPQANDRAHAQLLASLDVPTYGCRGAVGRPIDSDHPAEQSVALWWLSDLEAIQIARRFGQVAIFRVDEHGCQTIDCEIVAFDEQGVVLDLAYLAPTDERYGEAERAWGQLRAEDTTSHAGAREALARALRGDLPEWLLDLAADRAGDVRLRPPAMWSLPRDPNRIGRILELLDTAWRQQPDMRLGQLMANLLGMRGALFGVEDRDVEAALRAWLDERG